MNARKPSYRVQSVAPRRMGWAWWGLLLLMLLSLAPCLVMLTLNNALRDIPPQRLAWSLAWQMYAGSPWRWLDAGLWVTMVGITLWAWIRHPTHAVFWRVSGGIGLLLLYLLLTMPSL